MKIIIVILAIQLLGIMGIAISKYFDKDDMGLISKVLLIILLPIIIFMAGLRVCINVSSYIIYGDDIYIGKKRK